MHDLEKSVVPHKHSETGEAFSINNLFQLLQDDICWIGINKDISVCNTLGSKDRLVIVISRCWVFTFPKEILVCSSNPTFQSLRTSYK